MDQTTYIFLLQGVGFILGVVAAHLAEKRLNIRLIMAMSLITGSIGSGALPWVKSYPYLASMFFMQGLAKGLVDYAALSICNKLWPNHRGLAFQFVTLGAGIGAFFIPFIARPFLATDTVTSQSNVKCKNPVSVGTKSARDHRSFCISPGHIEYPYVIIAILCVPPAIAFCYYFVKRKQFPLSENNYQQVEVGLMTSSRLHALMMTILFFLHIPVMSMPLAYGDLLTSYGVHGRWHLSRRHMATMTSVFWGAFLVGRVSNLALTNCAEQFYLLCINFGGLFMTSIILCTWTTDYEVALWIGSAGLGFFSSPFLPMILTWVSECACLTGSMISVCLCASGIGEVLVPVLSGWVFVHGGPQSLMYLIAGIVLCEILLFVALVLVARETKRCRDVIINEELVDDT
ncbi:sodium-dependent glucose transporter 1-like [Gigantopelta aegis]|uniref:sodium-dependent glucose transporter 1-like n=1 Tax=Gigantopelta aegis TaxID=1735272 RepID=UPI001B887FED|nr:sodium-dependent glucose transporter 1-like [Gigantopelta aegis]